MEREFKVEELSNCPLCGSRNLKYIIAGFDGRYGQPDDFDVFRVPKLRIGYFLKAHNLGGHKFIGRFSVRYDHGRAYG